MGRGRTRVAESVGRRLGKPDGGALAMAVGLAIAMGKESAFCKRPRPI